MFAALRKLILLLLIACLPMQGMAMCVMSVAHHEQQTSPHTMQMGGDMAGHDCCPHDDSSPAQPQNSCGDGSHCPLCHVSVTPTVILPLLGNGDPALYPAPLLSISLFYPEQPQRPPLNRVS